MDVRQGAIKACAFLAALSGLAEKNPDFIKENLIEYGNNFVIVRFFYSQCEYPLYVMVQKTIPDLLENEGAFLSNNCLWVHMYLKAFVAMGIAARQINNLEYSDISYTMPVSKLWFPGVLTGEIINMEPAWQMEEEQLYKKIKETLKISCMVLCEFSDGILCRIPILKYFFNEIINKGLVKSHAYSVSRVYEDGSGIKWVCCRNPWGHFVPAYDKDGKLYANEDDKSTGYFWLKLKDFHKYCDRIYFSTEKNIAVDVKFNKLKRKTTSIQNFNR